MLFQKLHELFEFIICGFRMIILYLSIVVSLCELVYVSIDCGVGGVYRGSFKSAAGCLLYAESGTNNIFTFRSDFETTIPI